MQAVCDSAVNLVTDAQRRLRALAADPPYRFVRTKRAIANAHRASLVLFSGSAEVVIAKHEERLGGTLPEVYRAYVLAMGHRHGHLFRGSDVDFERRDELRALAVSIADRADLLPNNAEVFRVHQGYSCSYVLATGGFDGPVYTFEEGDDAPHIECSSFAELLDRELSGLELNHRRAKENGGYYLELGENGSYRERYPALAAGERPLSHPDRYSDGATLSEVLKSRPGAFRAGIGLLGLVLAVLAIQCLR